MYYAIPEGSNYAIYQNGTRVSTTSAAGLVGYGLSTSNLGSATTTPSTTTPATTQQNTSSSSTSPQGIPTSGITNWTIAGWSQDPATGGFAGSPPVLTVNGKSYTFSTPAEYVTALQTLKNSGATNIDSSLGNFQAGVTYGNYVASQKVAAQTTPATQTTTPTTAPATTPTTTKNPPTVSLQPGSTDTANVKLLQDYLVSKGLLDQSAITGANASAYGNYGPQTTAAVASLQNSLGVNNSGGVGYYGPLTIAAINSTPATTTPSTTTSGTTTSTTAQTNPSTSTSTMTTTPYNKSSTIPSGTTRIYKFDDGYFAYNPATATATPVVDSAATASGIPIETHSGDTAGGIFATWKITFAPNSLTNNATTTPTAAPTVNNSVTPTPTATAQTTPTTTPVATTQTTTSSVKSPPTVSLQPGSTDTASVKQLQDYLVSKGYMTQAQVDTGYGTYGPATTAAVQALQSSLGVNNTSGPGYYGPLTISAVNGTAPASTTTPTATPTTTPTTPTTTVPTGTTTPATQTTTTTPTGTTAPTTGTATPANTTTTSQTTKAPPTASLQPGATGDDVKKLQDYLVSKGYMTQAQVDTGYGTYGPQTTAAVAALQTALGVNNSSGVGYYGPLTISAINNATTIPAATNNPTTDATAPLTFNTNYGVTQDQWNQMNDTQRATIAAAYTIKQQAYQTTGQQLSFADALVQAAKDPNIIAKYADAAKIDKQVFSQNLQLLQQSDTTSAQQNQQQFETDRKALADQQAAKGAAYSGFRGQAQKQLGSTESGIVQSTRADLQQKLNTATQDFEQKYGTSATTPATSQFTDPYASSNISLSGQYKPVNVAQNTLAGSTIGGVTGTQPVNQQNDVNTKATDLYNLANVTPTVK